MFFAPSKSRWRAKIWSMGALKAIYHIQIKNKMPNSSQEHQASSKAPNQDLNAKEVLCTFKFKIESVNLKHGCPKNHCPYLNKDKDQEPPASSKAPNQVLKDINFLCTFKFKIESKNWEHRFIKDKWPYPNQDQDVKPPSGSSSVLQSPKWGFKGHGCSLHLQNQDREPKFGSWVCQRPVTIFKSRSRCQTPVRNLQHPPKPQMRT